MKIQHLSSKFIFDEEIKEGGMNNRDIIPIMRNHRPACALSKPP